MKMTKEQIEELTTLVVETFTENEVAELRRLALRGLEAEQWKEWKGEGLAPASWMATNPYTGERTKVYRSYEDYVDD